MALYTGKGDNGTTKTFGCNQRISKHSTVVEALGALDELNSFLGLVKVKADESGEIADTKNERSFAAVAHSLQSDLFIIQAEIAGAEKHIEQEKVDEMSKLIDRIERELPEITTFFIPGGTELAAMCDVARSQSRRVERRVVEAADEGAVAPGEPTLAYLNRLSSVLYAMARLANHRAGFEEEPPSYE